MLINYDFGFDTIRYQFHLEPPSASQEMDKSSKWISEAEPGTAFMDLVFLSKTTGNKGGIISSPQKNPTKNLRQLHCRVTDTGQTKIHQY